MQLNLGSDVTLCNADSLMLFAGEGYYCYKWQDSSGGATYNVKQNGSYYVTVVTPDLSCSFSDTIQIQFGSGSITKPVIIRKADSLIASAGYSFYQWYLNDQPINGADQYFIIRSTDGNYKIKVTDASNCSIFSDTYNTTGFPVIIPEEILVYPNPVDGLLHIELTLGSELFEQAELLNVTGQTVHLKTLPENSRAVEMNCEGLASGLYLLKLTTNTKTFTQKIIIQ